MGELDQSLKQPDGAQLPAPQVPRISISHLMLWTLCSSVYLAMLNLANEMQDDAPTGFMTLQQSSSVLYGLVAGATVAGAIIVTFARAKGVRQMLKEPGHWILVIHAAVMAVHFPLYLATLLLDSSSLGGPPYMLVLAALYCCEAAAFGVAVARSADLRWKVFFSMVVLFSVLQAVFFASAFLTNYGVGLLSILAAVPTWGRLSLSCWLFVVAVLDIVRARHRDWLHWLGVACYLSASATIVIWMVGTLIIGVREF